MNSSKQLKYINKLVGCVVQSSFFGLPIRWLPRIGARYVKEDQDAFTDSTNVLVASRENSIGQLFFGSETFVTVSENVEAYLRTESAWDFEEADTLALTDGSVFRRGEFGSTVGLGLKAALSANTTFQIEGAIEDLFRDDFETYSGRTRVNVTF